MSLFSALASQREKEKLHQTLSNNVIKCYQSNSVSRDRLQPVPKYYPLPALKASDNTPHPSMLEESCREKGLRDCESD